MASQVADAQRVMARPARIVPPRSAAKGFRMGKFPTNAGGIADLVTETTGLLTDIDYNEEALLSSVLELSKTKFKDKSYRQGVQAFWDANYNADKN